MKLKMGLGNIQKAAMDFRNAIEKCQYSLGESFQYFPRGSCGDAAILLGRYLTNQGHGEFQYMVGSYGSYEDNSRGSHAWLQLNGVIVDITADQFPDFNAKVIVTTKSDWHESLIVERNHTANYGVYDPNTVKQLEGMYQTILECIEGVDSTSKNGTH